MSMWERALLLWERPSLLWERASLAIFSCLVLAAASLPVANAQPAAPAPTPRAAAALDLTGYWVAVVTEDWKFRMVTPNAGAYAGIPLNAAGRRVADAWDPARDKAAGEACKAYGAASIMRVPGRLHVTWENDATLRINTDAGEQTRLLHFDAAATPGEATWQGHSVAKWRPVVWRAAEDSPNGGGLEVVTTGMRSGYLRKNGVPYSENAMLTEYFNRFTAPNGDEWLVVTTIVDDPTYLNRPYVTSSNFKQLPDAAGFNPTPCSAT